MKYRPHRQFLKEATVSSFSLNTTKNLLLSVNNDETPAKGTASSSKNPAKKAEEQNQIVLPSEIQKAIKLVASYTEKPRKLVYFYYKKAAKESKKLWKRFVNSGFSVEKLLATQIAALLVYTIISSFIKYITRASGSRRENKLVKKVYVSTPGHAVEGLVSNTINKILNDSLFAIKCYHLD